MAKKAQGDVTRMPERPAPPLKRETAFQYATLVADIQRLQGALTNALGVVERLRNIAKQLSPDGLTAREAPEHLGE